MTATELEARFDAIFAAVRHCSKTDVWQRVQTISLLLEQEDDTSGIRAAEKMERLNDRLSTFARAPRGEAYAEAREHLMRSWRYLMRGNYAQARACLALAADCCDEMA